MGKREEKVLGATDQEKPARFILVPLFSLLQKLEGWENLLSIWIPGVWSASSTSLAYPQSSVFDPTDNILPHKAQQYIFISSQNNTQLCRFVSVFV